MVNNPSTLLAFANAIEIALWITGAIVLVRAQFSSATLPRRQSPPLQPWDIPPTLILQMALCVILVTWAVINTVSHLGNRTLGPAATDGALWTLVQGAALQFGLLAGILLAALLARFHPRPLVPAAEPATPLHPHPFLAATGVFLIALPVVTLAGLLWKTILQHLGADTRDQELVDIFRQADSPGKFLLLTLLAVVVAPLTEELLFRAGLFRYLRTRVPRWFALAAPAALFASLHDNAVAFLPLFLLGLIFSLAYERTGRITVTILAHALFNLHTILLITAGVTN